MIRVSVKSLILLLYSLLIVCMGGATVIEKLQGTDSAVNNVYGTWWFICLWSVLTILSILFLVKKKVYTHLAVCLLHLSFVVILLGALTTHLTAENGTIHLRKGLAEALFFDKDNQPHKLPFSMSLNDFEIRYYPGTDAVMDYCCQVSVTGKDLKDNISVSMNNIGKVSGYRFYQSAYDSDGRGTQLLVAHDPYGIAITYTGYVLLLVSLLWTMMSKHTRLRSLYRMAIKPVTVTLLLFAFASNIQAQHPTTPIDKNIANEIGEVAVLYNGRICPINTVATEFVTKLCGKSSWQHYSANEIFVGWMIYYTEWEEQKIIRVKNAEVQNMLGISGQWASVNDFYTSQHQYKLSGKTNDTSLDAATRKAVRDVDEKIQVVAMFYNSEMLRIFPLATNGKMTWYTPGSTELPLGVPEPEFQFINHVMDFLTESILTGDAANAHTLITKIKIYQREKARDVMPSGSAIKAELLYNKLQSSNWVVYLCLLLSLCFCMLSLADNKSKTIGLIHTFFCGAQLIYLSVLLIMRWWISGHVPVSNGFETMLFMAWITLVISLLLMRKIAVFKALGPVVSAFCMLVAILASGSPQITNLMPVLQSPLLSVHVALVMISYALFAMITLVSADCLYLHKKHKSAEFERMTAVSQLLLYPAVALLAIGIFIGAVWANVSWGTYWSWDPKETWALITLMIYAVALHRTFGPSASAVRYNVYVLLAFLTVLMTYFGVNCLLSGMHSYA